MKKPLICLGVIVVLQALLFTFLWLGDSYPSERGFEAAWIFLAHLVAIVFGWLLVYNTELFDKWTSPN